MNGSEIGDALHEAQGFVGWLKDLIGLDTKMETFEFIIILLFAGVSAVAVWRRSGNR